MNGPNTDEKYPLAGNQNVQFAKNMVSRSNVEIGDYTYYSAEAGESFAERITDHYEFIGDRLLIGKFNAIASGGNVYDEWRQSSDGWLYLSFQYFWQWLGKGDANVSPTAL